MAGSPIRRYECFARVLFRKIKALQLVSLQRSAISFKWCHQESNRGHKDFQSVALPTEL